MPTQVCTVRKMLADPDDDQSRWEDFVRRYKAELSGKPDQLDELRALAQQSPVTLVFVARDELYNQAVALKDIVAKSIKFGGKSSGQQIWSNTANRPTRCERGSRKAILRRTGALQIVSGGDLLT